MICLWKSFFGLLSLASLCLADDRESNTDMKSENPHSDFMHMFLPESGLDWCEWNYRLSYITAEFFNTVTNLPIIILPLLGLRLSRNYVSKVNPSVKYVYLLMSFVGITSAYYHATLSLFGQLLDELCLLWVTTVSFIVWLPSMKHTPTWLRQNMESLRVAMGVGTILASFLCFIKPSLNAYFLIILCVPCIVAMISETKGSTSTDAGTLAALITTLWGIAVAVWISDRLMCTFWRNLGFPYLHALWHLASGVGSYMAIVLFSFFDAEYRVPNLKPEIVRIPKNFPIKIPYIVLRASGSS